MGPDRPNMIDERELDPEYGEEPYIGTDDEVFPFPHPTRPSSRV